MNILLSKKRIRMLKTRLCTSIGPLFRVNRRNLYIGSADGQIKLINRWTREKVKILHIEIESLFFPPPTLIHLEVDEKVLVAKSCRGPIIVFDLVSIEEVQRFTDKITQHSEYTHDSPICLRINLLVNSAQSFIESCAMIFV